MCVIMYTMEDKKRTDFESETKNNLEKILSSKRCFCLMCGEEYDAREVQSWHGTTAICPWCGSQDVLGDSSGIPFNELNHGFPKESNGLSIAEVDYDFLNDYESGTLERTPELERLYIAHLRKDTKDGSIPSRLLLGLIYESGTEFREPNPFGAFQLYKEAESQGRGVFVDRLANMLLFNKDIDIEAGFSDLLVLAVALGSTEALVSCIASQLAAKNMEPNAENLSDLFVLLNRYMVRLYEEGIPLYEVNFLYKMLTTYSFALNTVHLNDALERIEALLKRDSGFENREESGDMKDVMLKFLLIAKRLEADLNNASFRLYPELKPYEGIVEKMIDMFSENLGFAPGEPTFDYQSFLDTFLCGSGDEPYPLRGTVKVSSFDMEKKQASVTIVAETTPVFCDLAAVYCGDMPKVTEWRFDDVVYASDTLGEVIRFTRISVEEDERLLFLDHDNVVAEFSFEPQEKRRTDKVGKTEA